MTSEIELREKLARCTRIFAMQGLLGVFGHVSAYDPERKRVFLSPGMGADRSVTKPEDIFILESGGDIIEPGKGDVAIEWPIHTAVHATRTDALAVAHLHSPCATLFGIAKREFRPVTLQGTIFAQGVPLYHHANLVKTAAQGRQLVDVLGDKRAVLMRGHGTVVIGRDLEEVLFSSLVLEDDALKTVQAATLGEVGTINIGESGAFDGESGLQRRSRRTWDYLVELEARWDRQPSTGKIPLLP